jgi:hypothetical protein
MYTAPSPFDEPTAPIDAETLRTRWTRHRREAQVTEQNKPRRAGFIRQR